MRTLVLLLIAICAVHAADTLVCLGDSLTAGYGVSESDAYPAKLEAMLAADHLDWKVVNAGVSGDTSAGGLRRIDWVLKAKPTLVFVALGANDGLRGQPVEALVKNLGAICDRLARAKVRVALAGMQLPVNYGDEYRRAFGMAFAAVATPRHLPLMPFLLEGVGGVPDLNQADGVHPTAAGQTIVAEHVYAFLKPLLAPVAAAAAP